MSKYILTVALILGAVSQAGAAQQGAAQAQAQNDQAIASFKQAAGACLSGRGYTVN